MGEGPPPLIEVCMENEVNIKLVTLATLGNITELVVSVLEESGGNEIMSKEPAAMANDVAAILNNKIGAAL